MSREWLWGFVLFSRAVLFGGAAGLYYELFRFLRLTFSHPAWLVAVEDLLFFLPASVAHIFFHYAYGEGETRWFGVLGVILGFLLYLASVGKIVQKVLLRFRGFLSKKVISPLKRRINDRRELLKEKRARRKAEKQKIRSSKRKKRKSKTERIP